MKEYHTHVLIVGGGIAGASLAYYLSREIRESIILVDRGRIGSEASGLSAGTINRNTSPVQKLHDLGYRFGMEKCSTIVCAKHAQDLLPIPHNARLVVGNKNIAKLEPELAGGSCHAALVYKNSMVVDPGELTRAFASASRSAVLENTEISKIERLADGRFRATSPGEKAVIYCHKLALCPGAWSKQVGEMAGCEPIPIVPVKGQVWVTEHATPLKNIIYAHSRHSGPTHTKDRKPLWRNLYGRKLPDGRALFGGARLPARDSSSDELYGVEEEFQNMEHVYELLPNMRRYGVLGGWAGPMPFGPLLAKEVSRNCWVITGLGSHGFKDGPLLAEKVAKMIRAQNH